MVFENQNAMRIAAPSPLVGEGMIVGKAGLAWVRGFLTSGAGASGSRPLTRLRFAEPPSPTRGEGEGGASGESRRHRNT